MQITPSQKLPNEWPQYTMSTSGSGFGSGQFATSNHRQPRLQPQGQPRPKDPNWPWLSTTPNTQLPLGKWIRHPYRPCIEEFVPPYPPQALGVGKGKSLTWPTVLMDRSPTHSGVNVGVGNIQEISRCSGHDQGPSPGPGPGPTGHQSFFQRQMIKQDQERRQKGETKQELTRSSSADDTNTNAYRGTNQDVLELFGNFDSHPPSMGAQSSRHIGSFLGKRRRGGREGGWGCLIDSLPPGCSPQHVSIHVQSSNNKHPSAVVHQTCILPDNLITQLPRLTRPSNPEQLRKTLATITPTIVYAEFICPSLCRTRGICLHFSFVLGCKKVPDGLICHICHQRGVEKAVHADRLCARHNNKRLSSFTMNLAEDVLATREQADRATEILWRSLTGDWDEFPVSDGKVDGRRESVTALGQRDLSLPTRAVNNGQTADDCDVAASSIEMIPEEDEHDHEHEQQQVAKKAKVDDQNMGGRHDDNVGQLPPTLEHDLLFHGANPYADDFEALMQANREFGDDVSW